MPQRYCFALDLKDDEAKIAEYEEHHKKVWPGVIDSFSKAGIENVELYRTGVRLFMILETNENFSFERKEQIDQADPVVQKWEALMSTYQQLLPWADKGQKWILMKPLFLLNK